MRPAARSDATIRGDTRQAAGILARSRLIQHHERRPHGRIAAAPAACLRDVKVVGIIGGAVGRLDLPEPSQRLLTPPAVRPAQVARPERHFGPHLPLEKLIVGILKDVADPTGELRHGVLAGSQWPTSPARSLAATDH